MPAQEVRIVNPVHGGRAVTSMERAQRFVRHGRAVFVDTFVIRFCDTPMNAVVSDAAQEKLLAQNSGYDRTSGTFFDAARHIPVIDAKKMIREERSPRKWSFVASVLHRNGQNENNNANPTAIAVLNLRTAVIAQHGAEQTESSASVAV